MGELLQQTLDLYSESWKKDHDEVMKKYNTADCMGEVVSFGIFLFGRLMKRLNSDGTGKVQSIEPTIKAFEGWHSATSHVLSQAEALQSEGFDIQPQTIEQLRQLKDCHAQAGSIIEELLDAKRAVDSVTSGTAISLDAFINELRNPVH